MALSISGLGSGFDWQSMIDQLNEVEVKAKITPLNTQKSNYQSKLSAWDSLGSKLSSLLTAVNNLKDSEDYNVFSATLSSSSASVSAESILSATAGSSAGKGSYDIKVTQLATAEKLQSNSVASMDSDAGWTGSITLEGNDISLDGKSLQSLRDEINALNSGDTPSGVVASILQVSSTDFRLILTAEETGSTGISLTDAAGDYFVDTPLQAGQDAQFSVDGIAMTRSANTVTDAIPGLTLNLLSDDAPTTAITLNVDRNDQAIENKIRTLVDTYNGVISYINQQMTYNEGTSTTGGALFGDTMVKSIKSNLQNTILNAGLSGYGISFDNKGQLTLDSDDLQSELGSDFATTETALTGLSESLHTLLNNLTDSIDGTVTLQKNSAQNNIKRLESKITSTQDLIDRKMESLTAQYIAMDAALNEMQTLSDWLGTQLGSLSS